MTRRSRHRAARQTHHKSNASNSLPAPTSTAPPRRVGPSPVRLYSIVAAVAAPLAAVGVALVLNWPPFPAWLLGASVVTFLLYGYDKRQAVRGGGRVPEAVLLTMGIAGGFMGGFLGMLVFHHKTRKIAFYAANMAGLMAVSSILFMLPALLWGIQ